MGFLQQLVVISGLALLVCLVQAEVHYHDFVLREENLTRLCNTNKRMLVNGQFPGPTLYVHKGDTVFVNVHNQGGYKLTIHWHGVRQPRNPWSDGTEYITQCAIKPGTNFTYQVIFSDEEGTLWWHAHSDWTRNTVHGAIVIYPQQGSTYPFPPPYAEEILILGSWYIQDVNLLVDYDLETGADLPKSDAYTINGQLGDFAQCSKEHTYHWMVDYGKTYLLRLVNAVMNAEMFFAIAGHNLTVVSQDAAYLKPILTSYIVIGPGQTMDVLVTADQKSLGGQYYIAARQSYSGKASFIAYSKFNVTAILQYIDGNYTQDPETIEFPTSLPDFEDENAAISFRNRKRSLTAQDVPKNITTRMYIAAAENQLTNNQSGSLTPSPASSLNNVTWVNPWADVLEAYYKNMTGFYTEDFPDYPLEFYDFVSDTINTTQSLLGTKVKVLEYGEEVEMIFQSSNVLNASDNHLMHLHGHSFYVVGSGYGNFDFDQDPESYNLVDPPLVNTATLPKKGWVTVRFKALNPGVWLWHCHFDKHYTWGMNTVIIVKNGPTAETSMLSPPAYMPPCDAPSTIQKKTSQSSTKQTTV
ncbi:putative laccase-9 [Mangifera indica]|uniref:putative laccase-9 n=1 Tax=Mangifera indica TaxID=29780 RepID=UPI001CF9EE2A|nr:putative laccase-9 [Mangifera indica]